MSSMVEALSNKSFTATLKGITVYKSILIATLACIVGARSASANDAFADISGVVQMYLDGTAQGKPQLVEQAFLPSLEVQWLGDGDVLLRRPGLEYIDRIQKDVLVPRKGRIVAIDATEKSAMVKVEIDWNDRRYTDYMLLLKVEGSWKVANKIATWVEINQ